MPPQESYLESLIKEVNNRSGALILTQAGAPQAVVLSIARYNQLAGSKSGASPELNNTQVKKNTFNVLVTGGAGYIGGHVVNLLLEEGHTPIVLDNFITGKRDHIPSDVTLYEGNVGDRELLQRIFLENKIDAVMHLAASLEVEESVSKPWEYFENNVGNTLVLLEEMKNASIKKFIFSSTAAVYGEQEVIPIPENAALVPNNPYGATKKIAEEVIQYFAKYQNFETCVLRYFNVAGCVPAYGVVDTHKNSHLVPIVLDVARGNIKSFKLNGKDYPTFDGTCVRDFVHVQDIAVAHITALENETKGFNVYNIGTGKGFSVEQVLQAVTEITGRMIPLDVGVRRPGDAAITVADSSLIEKELGYTAKFSSIENIIQTSWEMLEKS